MEQPGRLDDMPPSQKPAASPTRRLGWLRAFAGVALVCALLAAFGGVALWRPGSGLTLATLTWKTYHDPLGLFSVRLPPGWTAQSSGLGMYTEGDRQGSFSGQDEGIAFHDPTRGAGSTTLGVYVMQIPDSPVAAAMNCSARAHETATFNGYPADTSQPAVILFESANAHFQIGETIPGVVVPVGPTSLNPPPTPTAAPAATVTADKALIAAMLASFRPTDPHPLVCH